MRNKLLALLLILIGAVIISWPLTKSGLPIIHDDQQVARLFVFDQAIKHGQFPVRWVDGLGFGFGYPLFVFYPPLVYMIGELFHLFGFSFINSIKLVFFTGIFLSGITMYIFAKDLWGEIEAVMAALFYMIIPYRALDVYVRGALAESFSFVWLPAILWAFYKLSRATSPRYWLSSLHEQAEHFPSTRKYVFAFRIHPLSQTRRRSASEYKLVISKRLKYLYFAAIFMALLMITHNLIFLPFMLILPFYLFFLILVSDNKKKFIVNCFWSIVASLGLSAFFWMPALLEKKYTIVDQLLLVNLADYKTHFVYPGQLWNWTWGFGGSAPGLADGISFKIGKLHVLVSAAALILAIIRLVKNKMSTKINAQLLAHRSASEVGSIVFFLLFVFSAFMTTFYSQFIWTILPPLAYLQFPWRFLTFTALFSSILAGSLISLFRLSVLKLTASFIMIILLLIPNLKLFKPQYYRSDLTDKIATSQEVLSWDVSSSSFEYLPKGVELYKSNLGTNIVKIEKSQIPAKKVEVDFGQASVSNLIDSVNKVSFTVDARTSSKIRANIFDFPTWQVTVDDHTIPIDSDNYLKLITFKVSEGIHQVKIEFKNTHVRFFANLISLFSILVLIILIIKKWQTSNFREI